MLLLFPGVSAHRTAVAGADAGGEGANRHER
jgi:hypothetical protein